MRLTKLSVSGFRGLTSSQVFDLEANAIVVVGSNGQGKTSLFDAVLWGLTGRIPRLGDEPQVVSLYSDSGQARVEIELRGEDGAVSRVIRSHDGFRAELTLHHGDQVFRDEAAESRLHESLWPDAVLAPDAASALTTTFTRSVYLQQDVVREFIDGDTAQERFTAVSELVGAGRVTELALSLERAKKAWSTATNRLDSELNEVRERSSDAKSRLDALTPVDQADEEEIAQRWRDWWERAAGYEHVVEEDPPKAGTAESAAALDLAVKRLDALRRSLGRRIGQAEELRAQIATQAATSQTPVDLSGLAERVQIAERQVGRLREEIAAAEAEAAGQRRQQVERRQRDEELRALAELAFRHLDGPCPVCTQEHDESKTRQHLQELLGPQSEGVTGDKSEAVSALARELEQRQLELSQAQAAQQEAEGQERERARWAKERGERLRELGIVPDIEGETASLLDQLAANSRAQSDAIDALEAEGERLSLDLAGAGERARRGEYEAVVRATEAELATRSGVITTRRETGDRAGEILDALREVSSDVVTAQLKRVEPLLQRIYATADPHPSLRDIRLALTSSRGRGHLNTPLDDFQRPVSAELPEAVLSSSQLNALAVSVFLALNLGVPTIPLRVAMLDDPLQSLDDVNLLGLIDLLRRTKDRRQLIVSTHDRRFGRLLSRKLRPVSSDERTRVIELTGWGRTGPVVYQSDTPMDSEIIRIAA